MQCSLVHARTEESTSNSGFVNCMHGVNNDEMLLYDQSL